MKGFLKLTKITLVSIYLVIIAGSVVRMSGSGMGCPDWPKCFGQWVPPTDISQIPVNYKEIYSAKRAKKLENFCRLLDKTGFQSEANAMRNDPSLLEEQDFNAAKTWTEYVNRLIGFISGNLTLLQFVISLWFFKRNKWITILSFLNLVLIMLTAWFGAVVVATKIVPWVLTVHMLLALVIILLQVRLIAICQDLPKVKVSTPVRWVIGLILFIAFAQILMGTQIRQQIDVIAEAHQGGSRHLWIDQLSTIFYVHRSFSWMIVLSTLFIWWKTQGMVPGIKGLFTVIGIAVISGALLSYFAMPAILQPIHLLLSTIMLGFQMWMWKRTTVA
ncbi:MAG: COX15/CtaA family protein [Flavobacteriales bacterium]|nr:COX15/CtaA family protein [Flavobacteriales bacterium]